MQGKITRKVNFDNLINMILINMTYSRVFSNARFPTAAFIDVWTVTNNVRCLEKTGIDVNFADLKNAFMLEWTEKVMNGVTGALPGIVGESIPSLPEATGPALPF